MRCSFLILKRDPGECHNRIDQPEYQTEVAKWKGYLVAELAVRDCGWVADGDLVSPPPEAPHVSPYKNVRWEGEA